MATELLSSGVKKVFSSNGSSFAALKADKSVVIWGEKLAYGDNTKYSFIASDVNEIHPNQYGYALIKDNCLEIVKEGKLEETIDGIFKQVVASNSAFAYIREDGTIGFSGAVYFGQNHDAILKKEQVFNGLKLPKSLHQQQSLCTTQRRRVCNKVGAHRFGGASHRDFVPELANGVIDIHTISYRVYGIKNRWFSLFLGW